MAPLRAITTIFQTVATISSVLAYAGDPSSSSSSSSRHALQRRHAPSTFTSSGPQGQLLTHGSGLGEPYFADPPASASSGAQVGGAAQVGVAAVGGVENVTAQLEITTYLHCRVNNLGGKTVSWLKRHGDTPHLLTFGQNTYSNDARFQIFHEQPNDWKLQIQFPKLDDQGVYECHVSSSPPLVKRVRLNVVVPEIEIVDERDKSVGEKFYKGGSTIELKCIVRQIVGQAPEYIIWHHEDRMLNYDTERGGISVKTDLLKSGAISRLYIARAGKRDSGNYTCGMRNAQTSITVHILNGENPAAMQTGTSSHRMQSPLPLVGVLILMYVAQHVVLRAHQQQPQHEVVLGLGSRSFGRR